MIKAVIFDMDGVLADNRDLHIKAFTTWCAAHGMTITAKDLLPLFGMGNDEIFPAVFKSDLTPSQIEQYGQEKEALYRQLAATELKPLAGLVDFVTSLKQAGIKVAVGSSGMKKNVDMVVAACGLEGQFDAISNGDMVEKAKPAPDVFFLAAKLVGVEPKDCFVFEDSFAGIAAARAAGMGVGAVATTFSRGEHSDYDILIDDFTGLTYEKLLEAIAAGRN